MSSPRTMNSAASSRVGSLRPGVSEWSAEGSRRAERTRVRLSVVIAAYNSRNVVLETVAACVAALEAQGDSFEVVVVNDGSTDGTWQVLEECVRSHPRVVRAVNLMRNYGQHTALLCGLEYSSGERVVTLDDDLQNPPHEIRRLVAKADEGHDVVFGRYRVKRHGLHRRLGSWLVDRLNTRVFRKPRHLVVTNFRLLERAVVDRILGHRTLSPYLNGLAVLYSRSPANTEVEHHPRRVGRSNYGWRQISALISTILFTYSSYPLRMASVAGLGVAVLAFALSCYFFLRALLDRTTVPGWASVAVMMAFFQGMTLLILGMLGEYVVRALKQLSGSRPYHVIEVLE